MGSLPPHLFLFGICVLEKCWEEERKKAMATTEAVAEPLTVKTSSDEPVAKFKETNEVKPIDEKPKENGDESQSAKPKENGEEAQDEKPTENGGGDDPAKELDELTFLREQSRKYTEHLERKVKELEAKLRGNARRSRSRSRRRSVSPPIIYRGPPGRYRSPPPPGAPLPSRRLRSVSPPPGRYPPPRRRSPSPGTPDIRRAPTSGPDGVDSSAPGSISGDPKPPPPQYKVVYWEEIRPGRWEDILETEISKSESRSKKSAPENELAFKYRKFRAKGSDEPELPEVILGPRMCALLRKLLPHFPEHDLDIEDPCFASPFEMFVFNWDLLGSETAKAGEVEDELEKQDLENLKALMDIMSTDSGDAKLDAYFRSREANLKNGKATYETVWTLFPPGELVLSRPFLDQDQLFIVQDNLRYGWPLLETTRRRKPPPWMLVCWSYDWDGTCFERKPFEFEIEPFTGARSIDSLSIFPVKYYRDAKEGGGGWEGALKTRLLERGKRFRELCVAPRGSRMFDYVGLALSRGRGISAQADPGGESSDENRTMVSGDYWDEYPPPPILSRRSPSPPTISAKKSQVKGTVMVDFGAYYQQTSTAAPLGSHEPSLRENECGCSTCQKNEILAKTLKFDYDKVLPSVSEDKWEETQFLICPPRVMGYSMRDSHWAQLQVMEVKTAELDTKNDTFDHKLSLNGKTKKIIKDLVVNHEKGKRRDGKGSKGLDDLVEDKGKGLVLLFHGPPGVGKTLTAESVAKSTGKPLFSIGVSDIGVEARVAERNFRRFFNLATEWEAVMLIDEADVFLNSRGQGEVNLEKNALVSVLLRVLEYYEGILILTTNRINSFDVAVQSRVHLAVKYQNFDETQISEIYTIFLEQIKRDDNIEDWQDIKGWIRIESKSSRFNGRQIRNIVSAALGLARAEGKRLNSDHLDQIVKKTREFHDELAKQRQAYEMKQLAGGYGER